MPDWASSRSWRPPFFCFRQLLPFELPRLRMQTPRDSSAIGARSCNILLPAEMRKGFVGLRHLVDLVAFANRIALPLIGFQDFGGQSFLHGQALPGISKTHNPP